MTKDLLSPFDPDQIDLVGDDQSGDRLPLGADQKAVEHAHAWGRVSAGEDEDYLIGVGDDHLLIFALRKRGEAGDDPLAGLDQLDGAAPTFGRTGQNPVADDCQIALPAALFQAPTQSADQRSLLGFNRKETRLGVGDQTREGRFFRQVVLRVANAA
jgi:hypothetical protein